MRFPRPRFGFWGRPVRDRGARHPVSDGDTEAIQRWGFWESLPKPGVSGASWHPPDGLSFRFVFANRAITMAYERLDARIMAIMLSQRVGSVRRIYPTLTALSLTLIGQ